jgi:hypothetical protein
VAEVAGVSFLDLRVDQDVGEQIAEPALAVGEANVAVRDPLDARHDTVPPRLGADRRASRAPGSSVVPPVPQRPNPEGTGKAEALRARRTEPLCSDQSFQKRSSEAASEDKLLTAAPSAVAVRGL